MTRVLGSSVYVEQPGALGAQLLREGTPYDTVKDEAPHALGQLGDHVWIDVEEPPAEPSQAVGEVTRVQLEEALNRANQLETDKARLQAEVEQLRSETAELRQQLEASQQSQPVDGETDTQDHQPVEGGEQRAPLPEDIDKLNKAELKALAEERGIELDGDETNKQIVEKLKASEQS